MKMQGGDNMTIRKMGFYNTWFAKTKRVVIGLLLLGCISVLAIVYLILHIV